VALDLTARALVVGAVDAGADVPVEAVAAVAQIDDVRDLDAGATQVLATDDLATMAVAVVLGCRLIRTNDVRAAQRVCAVLAAVERARR
jgi:hypothetical protein